MNPKIVGRVVDRPEGCASGTWTRLHAAGGTGIRPPDAFEIAFTDNPNLKPERSKSVEAGVTQSLVGGALHVDATAFFNQYDDLIVSVGAAGAQPLSHRQRLERACARAGDWRRLAGRARMTVRASYTFLDTEIRAVDGSAQAPSPYHVGDPLLRRPRHQGSIAATWTWGDSPSSLTLDARQDARRRADLRPERRPLRERGPRGRRLSAVPDRLAHAIEAFARILNLFDRDYEEVFGYPSPGRTAFAGVRIAASR